MKKITPALKTSQTLSYFSVLSTKLAISGATYPGVPHLGNKYLKININIIYTYLYYNMLLNQNLLFLKNSSLIFFIT